jgi:conjugal transfer/type IV secretion protein DotA/TraY
MEKTLATRAESNTSVNSTKRYCQGTDVAPGQPSGIKGTQEYSPMGKVLCTLYQFWNEDISLKGRTLTKSETKNTIEAFAQVLLGVDGLLAMRGPNIQVHPMAQLSALGKSLVNSAVINVMASTVFSAFGGMTTIIGQDFGEWASVAGSIGMKVAFIGLTAGFILYYILPFLPFVYFFFAVGTWVKSIFEAMVGVPLWALAHLRLDGEGLPGDSASNGYFLILEIFLRPILTVFGLIAAMLIFTAQVRVLNFIWLMVVDNITGYEPDPYVTMPFEMNVPRGVVDQFFFTIIYTIIVYMLATASFKLIDKIADSVLRWMGAGVSPFQSGSDDVRDGLTRYAAIGGITMGQQIAGGVQKFSGELGGALGGMSKNFGQTAADLANKLK